jgi:hypothetical protein
VQPALGTAQVTWATKIPAGAAQVVYRFLDSAAQNRQQGGEKSDPEEIRLADFPFESAVVYECSAQRHWVTIEDLAIPEAAVELQVVALSRVCEDRQCRTLASPIARYPLP